MLIFGILLSWSSVICGSVCHEHIVNLACCSISCILLIGFFQFYTCVQRTFFVSVIVSGFGGIKLYTI